MTEEAFEDYVLNCMLGIPKWINLSDEETEKFANTIRTQLHLAIKESSEEKDEVIRRLANTGHEDELAKLKEQIDRLLNHCPDAECGTCGEIVCPFGDDFHFHHDGCPSCAMGFQVNGQSLRVSE